MHVSSRTTACALAVAMALLPAHESPAAEPAAEPAHRLIVGWDDAVVCVGPGTDAGMDSPEAIRRMVKRWKARGITGLYWRVNETQLPGADVYVVRNRPKASPPQNHLMARHDRVFRSFDVLGTLRAAAEAEGLGLWAWYPTIYSAGAPAEGPGFTTAWQFESRFGREHPEVLSVDRAGRKHYAVWEYAYPEARAAKIREFVAFAKELGFRKFVACLRTESGQFQPPPLHADQFGFNAPVVEEMRRRHGIDIRTDGRFDFASPSWNPTDPMVESWRRLRGEYLTTLYRELRRALDAVAPGIEMAVQIPGDRVGSCLGNWVIDWRTWIDEGLVQEIVLGVPLDNGEFAGSAAAPERRGYLPSAIPVEALRDFIRTSRHPDVRVIAAGGPATSFARPPDRYDGWRLDGWFDLWVQNWAQRWEQWRRDLAELGHVRFVAQDFDGPDVDADRCDGGFGEVAHRPDLRACPGFWYPIGGPDSSLPRLETKVRRGPKGSSVAIPRDAAGLNELRVRHDGRHDRSGYPFPGDTAVSSGTCEVECWVYREAPASALVVGVQYDTDVTSRSEIALHLTSADTVDFRNGGSWATSRATLKPGTWHRLTLTIDLEAKTWSAEALVGGRKKVSICQHVAYRAKENAWNNLAFSPQGATGSVCFVDEVLWRWMPSAVPTPAGRKVLLDDGFEGATPGTALGDLRSPGGGAWKVERGDARDLTIDADLSLGARFQSLRMRGGGGRAVLAPEALRHRPGAEPSVDVDVFLRGDSPTVWLTPVGAATTGDRTTIAVADARSGKPLMAVRAANGVWECWDGGKYATTSTPAAIDAWTRVHLRKGGKAGTYVAILEVIGEAPRELFRGRFGVGIAPGAPLSLALENERTAARPDGPAFDNLIVTQD